MIASPSLRGRRRFTLIEMLVVISIIMILASMLMPSLNRALRKARALTCYGEFKVWYIALDGYASDYGEWYPGVTFWGMNDWLSPASPVEDGVKNWGTFAAYMDDRDALNCPARSEARVPGQPRWPVTSAGNTVLDFWIMFGQSTRNPVGDTYYMTGGWTNSYWSYAMADGYGPVMSKRQGLQPGSVMMMDRIWTVETIAMDQPCGNPAWPPSRSGGGGCGYYFSAYDRYSNHNIYGNRMGEGANFLCADGAAMWIDYLPGDTWTWYSNDYYNVFMVPRDVLNH